MNTCRAPGCGARTTRYGQFCSAHKSAKRRHGHPEQKAVTVTQLRPYLKLVRARIKRNESNPVWTLFEDRWRAVVQHAEGILEIYFSGEAGQGHKVRAAVELKKLADDVPPRAILETVCALFVMQELDPRRFRSDDAFRAQLVRRVRSLTDVNAGEWTDRSTGRRKRAYRELPPKSWMIMSSWIVQAYGRIAIHLSKLEQQDASRHQQQQQSLFEAIAAIT